MKVYMVLSERETEWYEGMTAALAVARQNSKARPTAEFHVVEVEIRSDITKKQLILALLRQTGYYLEQRKIAVLVNGRKRDFEPEDAVA